VSSSSRENPGNLLAHWHLLKLIKFKLSFRRRLPNTVCHDNQQSNLSLLRSDGAYSNLQPHKYGAEINR
jgi:hypothetical protein